jgi:hypothetical protein
MAQNKFEFNTNEFIRELRNLPAEMTADAGQIVMDAANSGADTVRGIYAQHRVTGNLAKGVKVGVEYVGRFGAGAVVRSSAPHAWLFDNGSAARHWAGGKSTGKMWGRSAPTHAFVRTMIAARRRMYDRLAELLERAGFSVTGKAA